MSCAKIDPALHQAQKPDWIKVRLPSNPVFFSTKALISDLRLHTVCESAQCPNRWECWSQGTATFMIAGERCTRACGFCAVTTAKPFALEADEPQRVAEAVSRMGLKHVVITAVARDDLKDGGADHFARTIDAIREMDPAVIIEVLVPDFHAQEWCIQIVLDAGAGHFQSQHGDRGTPDAGGAFAREISDLARGPAPGEGAFARSRDQERRHARARRKGDRNFSRRWTICARSAARSYARPISSPDAATSSGRRVRHARALRGLRRDRARERVSSTSPPGRWSAARITRRIFIRSCGDKRNTPTNLPL